MLEALMVWLRRGLTALGVGVGILGVSIGLLYTLQEKLLYVPRIPGMPNEFPYLPDAFGMEYEDVELRAKDGTKLHAWFLFPKGWTPSQRRKHPVIIFLQENAGNMSMRLPFLQLVTRYLQCSVLAPSYRGYGLSEGSPNEPGLKMDSQAALDYLLKRRDIDPAKVSVMGKSLGGAVAIHLAAANPDKFRTVIVENTFTAVEEMASKVLPMLKPFVGRGKPCNFLIRNKWQSYKAIEQIAHLPLLLLSSLMDEMVPASQMRELYEVAKAAGARDLTWVDFPHAHHMDAYEVAQQQYWPALMHFFQQQHIELPDLDMSDDSDGSFEDLAKAPGVQAMREAGRAGEEGIVQKNGVTVHHRGPGTGR